MNETVALDVRHLQVVLGEHVIVRDLSLAFPVGRVTAVMGPNGAGKSTLLRVLAGLLAPTAGEVLLGRRPLAAYGRRELARRLAILPQRPQVPADMTVARLVACGRYPYGSLLHRDKAADRRAVAAALALTGMTDFAERQVASLSGGESQRAWLALALAQEPELLLLDEPTTYLDMAHQLQVMEIIRRVNHERGTTIIMVLHNLQQAARYADNLAILSDAELQAWGPPADVLTPTLLARVFGVRAEYFHTDGGRQALLPVGLLEES